MPKINNQSILSCKNIGKAFDSFVVLNDVSFDIKAGEKIGLVGANGSGKSTLLKIFAGLIEKDNGKISTKKDIAIGYIPQTFSFENDISVLDFLQLSQEDKLLSKHELLPFLSKFSFSTNIFERKIKELSSGEKTKLAVLRIMLSSFDLFLLDEPTNNLDLASLIILEEFILKSNKAFIVVSHDRTLLDKTVSKIIEIDEFSRKAIIYSGGFTDYLKEKEKNIGKEWANYSDSMEKISKTKQSIKEKISWVKKIEQKRTSVKKLDKKEKEKPLAAMLRDKEAKMGRRARILKDKLEKYQTEEMPERPPYLLPLHIKFDVSERSGDKVFQLNSVFKNLPEKNIGPIDLEIFYGDRVLVLGENGRGKTTFLKMLLNKISPDSGKIIKGKNIVIGYMPQETDFSPAATVLDILKSQIEMEEGIARRLLNRFRITTEDIHKKISELSSGERSRLMFAIIMIQKPNCVILDEPTNHIDLEVLTELEEALAEFKGTLIIVSHDRYFIKKLQFTKIYRLDGILKSLKSIDF